MVSTFTLTVPPVVFTCGNFVPHNILEVHRSLIQYEIRTEDPPVVPPVCRI